MRLLLLILPMVALVVLAPTASANIVGNDTQHFNPTNSGLDFVTVHGSAVLEPGYFNSGFFINHAYNALPSTKDALGNTVSSNNSMLFGDISLGYGLGYRLAMGVSFSYLMDYQTSKSIPGAQFAASGMNEIRTTFKYEVLRRRPIGLALVGSLNFNQVDDNPFKGRGGGPAKNLELVVDGEINHYLLALNLGHRWRDNGDPIPGSLYQPLDDVFIGSLGVSKYFPEWDLKFIGEVISVLAPKEDKKESGTEGLVGVKYDFLENASVQLGYGQKLISGLFTPDWRVYAGLNINFAAFDRGESGQADQAEQERTTNIYRGFVPQDIEKLRNQSFDDLSQNYEFVLNQHVPVFVDKISKPPFETMRLDGFDFDTASAEIKPKHQPLLDRLANYLKAKPEVIKLRVEGHTDSFGHEDRNRGLSQRRADAIKAYLEQKGVEADYPIEAIGYGSDKPIGDNSNFQGRTRNRRVEVRILRKILDPKLESSQKDKN